MAPCNRADMHSLPSILVICNIHAELHHMALACEQVWLGTRRVDATARWHHILPQVTVNTVTVLVTRCIASLLL